MLKQFKTDDDGVCESLIKEMAVMDACHDLPGLMGSPTLVPCSTTKDCRFSIEMPRFHSTLADYWADIVERPFTPENLRCMLRDVMWRLTLSIARAHAQGVVHRDLKPQNILVDVRPDGAVSDLRTVDFGICKPFNLIPDCEARDKPAEGRCHDCTNAKIIVPMTSEVVTLWYRAPELILGSSMTGPEIDVWSLGAVFAEMSRKNIPLLPENAEMEYATIMFQMFGTPDEESWPGVTKLCRYERYANATKTKFQPVSTRSWCGDIVRDDPEACDLMVKMLSMDPTRRIDAFDALAHPYFANHGHERARAFGIDEHRAITSDAMTVLVGPAMPPSARFQKTKTWRNASFQRSGLSRGLPIAEGRSVFGPAQMEMVLAHIWLATRGFERAPEFNSCARELVFHYLVGIHSRVHEMTLREQPMYDASRIATLLLCGTFMHRKMTSLHGVDLEHTCSSLINLSNVNVDMLKRTENYMFRTFGGVVAHPSVASCVSVLQGFFEVQPSRQTAMVVAFAHCWPQGWEFPVFTVGTLVIFVTFLLDVFEKTGAVDMDATWEGIAPAVEQMVGVHDMRQTVMALAPPFVTYIHTSCPILREYYWDADARVSTRRAGVRRAVWETFVSEITRARASPDSISFDISSYIQSPSEAKILEVASS